jgi:ATP-binding cassette subfamily B (MDR/TAP) protein 1
LYDLEGINPLDTQGSIEFRKLSFAYPSWPNMIILKLFSSGINKGISLALKGKRRSRNLIFISPIKRFNDPFKGKMSINGMDVKDSNLICIRDFIALVG